MSGGLGDGPGGLPLDQYTKTCPPGWRLGVRNYPIKRYIDLLKLWYHLTDFTSAQCGPAAAGRLIGRPFALVTEGMSVTKQDGAVLRGEVALAHGGEPASQTAAATPNALNALMAILRTKYGTEAQDQQSVDIDDFLDLKRGNTHYWST